MDHLKRILYGAYAIALFAAAGLAALALMLVTPGLGRRRAIARAGIPVFAQFGITPQTALRYGLPYSADSKPAAQAPAEATARLVDEAKRLEDAGASLLDFTNSGAVAGAAVAAAVAIPVLGGLGGGPWLDGRMRMVHGAIGYAATNLNSYVENYANVARITFDAISDYAEDVRAGRQLKGTGPVVPTQ